MHEAKHRCLCEMPHHPRARRYGISADTVPRWRERAVADCLDQSGRPHERSIGRLLHGGTSPTCPRAFTAIPRQMLGAKRLSGRVRWPRRRGAARVRAHNRPSTSKDFR